MRLERRVFWKRIVSVHSLISYRVSALMSKELSSISCTRLREKRFWRGLSVTLWIVMILGHRGTIVVLVKVMIGSWQLISSSMLHIGLIFSLEPITIVYNNFLRTVTLI